MLRNGFVAFLMLLPLAASAPALADVHVGPLLGFDFWHRNAPEETDATRVAIGLDITIDTVGRWPILELSTLYTSASDSFATQNSVDEKMWQSRFGIIYRVLPDD